MTGNTYFTAKTTGSSDNIRRVINAATADQICAGLNWYSFANYECARIGQAYGIPAVAVCAVTALLSPAKRWSLNLHHAHIVIDVWDQGGALADVPGFVNSVGKTPTSKALKALDLWAQAEMNPTYPQQASDFAFWLGVVEALNPNGKKVPAFFTNLADAHSLAVTVDSHAFGIWVGLEHKGNIKFPQSLYPKVTDAYTEVAQEMGLLPMQAQAISWIVRQEIFVKRRSNFSKS
jgi:hypothetical protein